MDNYKWLKRKFPNSYERIVKFFNAETLREFKRFKYRFGYLSEDVIQVQKYPKNTLVMFKNSNPVLDHNHPYCKVVVKCQRGFTDSGYHAFNVLPNSIIEITS